MQEIVVGKEQIIKRQVFDKVIDKLKEKDCTCRVKVIANDDETFTGEFLKVIWSENGGILLQNEFDRSFMAIEDVIMIKGFELSERILALHPLISYLLK
jgi:hypothetical protein